MDIAAENDGSVASVWQGKELRRFDRSGSRLGFRRLFRWISNHRIEMLDAFRYRLFLRPVAVTSHVLAFALLCAFDSQAHSQVVEAALEPTLASFESPRQSNSNQEQSASDKAQTEPVKQDKKEETDRKIDAKEKVKSFIPPQRPIGQVSIDLRPKPKSGSTAVPESLSEISSQTVGVYASTSDEMQSELFFTKSRNHDEIFAYQPLYFEEVNLERYGRTCGHLQPAVSSLRFFATIPLLPYAMTAYNPSTTYTRKWPYEAGWGAPRVRELEPLQLKPSLVQAGAITGLVFVLP